MTIATPHMRRRGSAGRIQGSKVVIKNLEKSVESLEGKVKNTQLQLQSPQRGQGNYDLHVIPLGRLPVEILTEIMGTCIQKGVKVHELTHICGHLRDIVVAMTYVWSHIRITPFYRLGGSGEDAFRRGIYCTSASYLDLLLTRAQSTPLKLHIVWPMKIQALLPLFRRRPVIQSLTFDLTTKGRSSNIPDFSALDMSALEHLHLINTDSETSKKLMDAALQSRCENFTLVLDTDMALVELLLRHRLLDRVVNLHVPFALVPSFVNSPEPPRISLPHVKTCEVSCLPKLLSALDLCNAESLYFEGTPTMPMLPIQVPGQLGHLRLSKTQFKIENISTHRPQWFSCLASLEIAEVRIEGNLCQHLVLPNLKQLNLRDIKFIQVQQNKDKTEEISLVRDLFLDTPALESLSLYRLEVDQGLVECLQRSPLLEQLRIDCCLAEVFIVSFADCLGNNRSSFAALKSFHVVDSWPVASNVPFLEFGQYCTTERPNLQVSGDAGSSSVRRGPLVSAVDWERRR